MANNQASNEVIEGFHATRSYFLTAAAFSFAINLLYLAAPIYMLQVYDRVISSSSITTLVMLSIILFFAFATLCGLDWVRSRILNHATIELDHLLAARVVAATVQNSTKGGASGSEPLRDFDNVRQFVTGPGIRAVFDLPWAPIYILVVFLLHWVLGVFALVSAVILVALALIGQVQMQAPLAQANKASVRNLRFTEMSLRNSEIIQAMGMVPGLLQRWAKDRNQVIQHQVMASDTAAIDMSLVRFARLSMQSFILGLGAYLVIERSMTAGAMFAGSFLLARALQPVEQIVGSWRNLVSARDAYGRVGKLLAANPVAETRLQLPRPKGQVSAESVSYAPPQSPTKPILRNISFQIEPGEVVGIIGPSGAGKSALIRHIVGVIKPSNGVVRLDGADMSSWPRDVVGQYIGYLPQDIELFSDTVAANIGRFQTGCDAQVIQAAQLAGVHEMILRFPDGYETQVGEGGAALSGGFRQRIGLARAVFGNPSLVVLDEPNSNLDAEGETALARCIEKLKANGTTVLLASHRTNTLSVADKVLVLVEGGVKAFGPRAEVLARIANPPATAVPVSARGGKHGN